MAEQATDAKEARWIISQIAQVTRQYRIAHGIGLPAGPVEQAQELDPLYRARPHLQYLSDRIAEAVRDVERGKNRQIAVSMPPRAGKSTLLSYHAPMWFLRRHPEWKIMMASYDGGLSKQWATNVRTSIEQHPEMGIALKRDGGKGSRWETVEGGSMFTTSVRGTMTGRGARVMIIDDPVKDFVESHSLAYRQNLWNWWLSVAQTRLEPPYLVLVVMCMTGDTPVLRPDGTETPLRDIRPGDEIATFTDEGEVTTSVVSNWASQGVDDTFAVHLASGRVVRANARHPFWVVGEDGNGSWVRLESLRAGMRVRCLTEPTEGSSARQMTATSPRSARACACPTTREHATQPVTGLRRRLMRVGGRSDSRVGTASRPRTTIDSSLSKVSVARSAEDTSVKSPSPRTGPRSSASITATTPELCEVCSVTTATSSLLAGTRPTSFDGPLSTSVVSTDEIVSIVPSGREEVFDIEVVGTHRFIANGLDVSNTRWHEDDFVGRLLSPDHEGDPRTWEKISLPAIADTEDDALKRDAGEPLISPLLDETPEEAVKRWDDVRQAVGTYTFCTPGESPVLMADWTTKPISEVKIGDRVMGYRKGTSEQRMTFEPTVVEEKSVRIDAVQRMTLESGAEVRCTETHRWYTGRGPSETEPNRKEYAPAQVGSTLLRYVPVLPDLTPQRQRDLDYIAGMLDGEGHFRSNVVTIAQSPSANPEVWARINEVLSRLGWSYRVERGLRPEGGEWGSYRLRDTRLVIHELLERTDLAKRQAALDAQWSSPRKPCRERDRVVEIVPEAEEPVYALQTGTGNYVVWGYASSNSSMYQQRPAPAKGAIFDSGWWRFWTMDPEKATDDGRVVYLDPSSLTGGQWVDSWDANFGSSETSRGGWVVGQRWVKQGANRYLVAQLREKWSFTQTLWAMKQWAGMKPDDWPEDTPYDPWTYTRSPYGNLVHERLVERKANGAALIDTLKEQIAGIKPITPTTSKENRARAVTPECESGNVFLPHPSDPGNEWVQDLLSELRNFPHDAHDDQVDALTQALSFLRGPGLGGVTNPARPRPGQTWQRPRNVAQAAMSDMSRRRGQGFSR